MLMLTWLMRVWLMPVWRGRPRPRAVMSGLTVVMLAKLNMFRRMLMTMIMPVFMLLRAVLLLEENLARQFLFTVDEDIHFGRADAAACHPRDFQARSDVQRRNRIFEELGRHSGVHQGAQKHIAAHAGEAVKVGYAHG